MKLHPGVFYGIWGVLLSAGGLLGIPAVAYSETMGEYLRLKERIGSANASREVAEKDQAKPNVPQLIQDSEWTTELGEDPKPDVIDEETVVQENLNRGRSVSKHKPDHSKEKELVEENVATRKPKPEHIDEQALVEENVAKIHVGPREAPAHLSGSALTQSALSQANITSHAGLSGADPSRVISVPNTINRINFNPQASATSDLFNR